MSTKKLWIGFISVMVISFAVLGYYGVEIYHKAPPIPEKVVSEDGNILFTGQDIKDGQNIWQSIGGQELGSVWGHGSYQAPDWTADWLHHEAIFILDNWSEKKFGKPFGKISEADQAYLKIKLQEDIRRNTYKESDGSLTVSVDRAEGIKKASAFYSGLFTDNINMTDLRDSYAIPLNSIKTKERMDKMNAFFFWASWACVTERPGSDLTYTHNWPHEPLVGNVATGDLHIWTGFSVIILLLGIALLAYHYARTRDDEDELIIPEKNPLQTLQSTPSMKATLKYFIVVTALIGVQVLLGIITAHYGVEGQAFYGLPLSDFLPYSISRTWHVQLAIFWIATSWLATGLYIAPAVSGYEPKFQRLGVNVLFGALLVIVVGSLFGQWMGVMQKLGLAENFWFGHQGYEYVDLGRFWQIFLFAGLFIWLFLMVRPLIPVLKTPSESRNLIILFVVSSAAISSFYGAGLMWGQQTNLAIAEYWRWWVVHLWVEGFFEVFAAVVSAFIFVKLGLLRIKSATVAVLFSTIIFLGGGIIGTFHHLYFTGTPTGVLALGATFSALEVVPLVLMGFEVWHNYKITKVTNWLTAYKWPIYGLISVAFWNLVGAGIFGFLINPPTALYYMQGLNTTAVHGHTALFGVYGMLGISLMLFVLRNMWVNSVWKNGALRIAFWSINIGLLLMVLISVLPVGLLQTVASVQYGTWYARSAEFMQQPHMETLRWLRVIGDTIFAVGVAALVWFVAGLLFGWSIDKEKSVE
ncbi:MAG: nitric-oxide reductase large subunit [Bacteroidetes bacterium]|nr:nitric-oxide reductase large subunit [Bacteroidota bacterium]